MKPTLDRLAVVTTTLDPDRAVECLESWSRRATYRFQAVTVWSGRGSQALGFEGTADYGCQHLIVASEILGVVPAFALGVAKALSLGAEIIACFHDDLLIEEDAWDQYVLSWFDLHPGCGLAGFGGGTGLADADIYQKRYAPYQLARQGFSSNMRDAEQHGRRVEYPIKVACLDGFSQIGRRQYWRGSSLRDVESPHAGEKPLVPNLFQTMAEWGLVHHAYDAALGAWAKRLDWDVWMLPIACHHFGGRTAVGDPRYAEWAESIVPGGDKTFWELAHKEVYERFRDVLPIRI